MKKQFILFALVLLTGYAIGQPSALVSSGPLFQWAEQAHEFGTIEKGTAVHYTFTFTNPGNEALIISSVKASCGCTVAEYSKDPVGPGAEGFVKVTFHPSAIGPFNKTISVFSNANDATAQLRIHGTVIESTSLQ